MSNDVIRRSPNNPILSADDVPYESSLVFNAGVVKFNGRYVMVFRNDFGLTRQDYADFFSGKITSLARLKTNIGLAFSDDGVRWEVRNKPCFTLSEGKEEIRRAYDPRLTVIDGRCYMCFAIDTAYGVCGGIAVTEDFEQFDILSKTVPDNRNMVLFPEQVSGEFVRLERPFARYGRKGDEPFDIWISRSPDCVYWGKSELLLESERVPFANAKIGPAAPPIKTDKGWLTIFHAVRKVEENLPAWEPNWNKIYYAGLMLLDIDNPSKIIGMYNEPLFRPETGYELEGYRGGVIFPGGMILEDSGEVKIYYGAADTVECLATADVNDLIKLCIEN